MTDSDGDGLTWRITKKKVGFSSPTVNGDVRLRETSISSVIQMYISNKERMMSFGAERSV